MNKPKKTPGNKLRGSKARGVGGKMASKKSPKK